ncbi:hypothetical protein QSJ19_03110 [Gordonia sp. ABSL11-1]|uniref:hypothetical protein n=1 Tax=Gordonia sp. ABSL11-1 TaxID=3053924 RepID=UPI002572232A|nr:hypothetical protein [Gordonia sp. ABSL11-1]MDL9944589.1 hypothetical protein [Gordonia sp. ABSL11-1]
MNQLFDRDRYDRALAEGAEEYRDVIDILGLAGIDLKFTQTGGMCAALEAEIDDGQYSLLITDADEPLAWYRTEKRGWGVGVYETEDASEAVWFETTENSDIESLIVLVDRALRR